MKNAEGRRPPDIAWRCCPSDQSSGLSSPFCISSFRRAAWIITPLAHTLIALPLVVRMLLPVVRAVPHGAREAAAVLGAAPWRVWLSIDLPLMARAAMGAAAFAFAVSLGEFGASSFLTRRTTATLPVEIARLLARTR